MDIPQELMKDLKTVKQLIEFLEIQKKILEGKTVTNTKGFTNKVKYHLLGFVSIEKARLCEKCKSVMILEKMDNKGTIVQANLKGVRIHRNATMDFNWLYFKCPKCGWGLCCPDR